MHHHITTERLRIKRLPFNQHTDFVVTRTMGAGEHGYEVIANFKTEDILEPYTLGAVSNGRLAEGYYELFNDVIWGISEGI